MDQVDRLLKIIEAINVSAPLIGTLIGVLKRGKDDGRSEEDILAEADRLAAETKSITEHDMSDQA